MYSPKYGANAITSSSGSIIDLRITLRPPAAPTVIKIFFWEKCVSNLLLSDCAIASLTSSKPELFIYPCKRFGSSLDAISIIASFTSLGGSVLGLPKLKSYTFSAPYFAAIFFPSSNMARITELPSTYLTIFFAIISNLISILNCI